MSDTVVVRFYAGVAAAAGRSEDTFPCPPGLLGGELIQAVVERYPALEGVVPSCAVLQGGQALRPDAEVGTDAVEFLPPFAGG